MIRTLIHHSKLDAEENFAITWFSGRGEKHKLMKAPGWWWRRINWKHDLSINSRYWMDFSFEKNAADHLSLHTKVSRDKKEWTSILSYEWFCCTKHERPVTLLYLRLNRIIKKRSRQHNGWWKSHTRSEVKAFRYLTIRAYPEPLRWAVYVCAIGRFLSTQEW